MHKIAIISTVKAPIEQLLLFINYHLRVGVDEIILFYDDPEDKGVDLLRRHKHVTTISCSSDYWANNTVTKPNSIEERQIINVNQGIIIAKSKNCSWFAHIDSDELISPMQDFKTILESCQADGLRFALLEAVPEREHYQNIYLPTLFKRRASLLQIRIAKILGCRHSIYSNKYFRGHIKSKMALKLDGKIRKFGIHGPVEHDESLKIVDTKNVRLLHFDCVGIENWKLKWCRRLDGSATAEHMSFNRNKQFEEYTKALEMGGSELTGLYLKLHTIPKYEKIVLFLLRMLTRVSVHHKLFNSSSSDHLL